MNTEYVIEYLFVNVFWIYIVFRFMKLFFEKEVASKWCAISVYIGFYVINSCVSLFFNNPLLNIMTSVLGIMAVAFLYQKSVLKNMVATCMIYIVSMLCDILVATLVSSYTVGMRMSVINNIISYLFILSVELLIEKTIQLRSGRYLNKYHAFAILGIPLSSIAIIVLLVMNGISIRRIVFLVSVFLLLINYLVMHLYEVLLKDYEAMYQTRFLKQEIEAYRGQIEIIEDTQKKIEYLKHDMKHHLFAISGMAESKDTIKIQEYIGQMMETIERQKEYVVSGNTDVDSILNYMIQKARDEGILVKTKIQIATRMDVECIDLNVILGNLLDNAIEAAKQSQEKELTIGLELDRNVIYLDVENSYQGELRVSEKEDRLLTTKKEKENHGYGISSVRAVLQKYNGCMDIEYTKERFWVKVMMYLPVRENA